MSAAPATPKRKRRWWVRVLRAMMLLVILLVLALSGGLWWVYSKRVVLLNNALTDVGPMRGTVGTFEVTRSGGIELHDLVFTDRATGAVVARVPHVSGQANLAKLPPDEIRSLTLRGPEITVTAALIETWRELAAGNPSASGAPPLPFGIRFAKVDIEDARVRYEHGDGTSAEATLDYHAEDVDVQPGGVTTGGMSIQDAHLRYEQPGGARAEVTLNYRGEGLSVRDGSLSTGEQELSIEDGTVKGGEVEAPFAIQKLHVKGRVDDGIVELTEVDLDQPGLRLTPELLAMFGLDFTAPAAGDAAGAPPPPTATRGAAPSGAPGLVRGLRIVHAKLRDVSLSARGFTDGNASGLSLPDTRARVSYEAEGIEWHEGAAPSVASQTVELRDVSLEAPDDSGHARFGSASLEFDTAGKGAPWVIESLTLQAPDIHWTPQLRTLLTFPQESTAPPANEINPAPAGGPPVASEKPAALPTVELKQVAVTDAVIAITDDAIMPFELHTKGSLRLANLVLDAEGIHSQSFQTLEVTECRLAFSSPEGQPARKPWLELPHGEAIVKPDDWNEHTRIARLALDNLVVRMRDGNTPWDSSRFAVRGSGLEQPTTPTQPPTENREQEPSGANRAERDSLPQATRRAAPAGAGKQIAEGNPKGEAGGPNQTANRELETANREPRTDELPWWKRINCGQLTIREGKLDMVMDAPKPVDMLAKVDITTQRMPDGGSQHTVRIADLTVKLPTLSRTPFPVAEAAELEGVVRLPEMWTQRRFDALHLTGASVELSEALLSLFEPDKPAADASAPETDTDAPALTGPPPKPAAEIQHPETPWQVGLLSVKDSAVTVSNLVPGLPAVKFGVSFEVKDTPLLAEDIADDVAPQRIELHSLKIPSPNGTARYVAELDSIFVRFSLGGLMRKEIEGIEIVSPTLFVGEDLFWYVDFYRKYAERGGRPAPEGPHMVANDEELDRKLAAEVAEAEPSASQASWSVKRLQVHSGKLTLAPKGIPLKGFHKPFPFHIDSEVTRGTLNADMQIPEDTYELPDLNLQFVGMTGRVQFNLPLKQKDNNLVETFEVDSVRWKGLRTGKAYLSVTYDSAGIYSKFGAEAYEGYLNGEFNLYTDDSFHWDGWIGGKDVQTHKLTRILCPGYFIMDGKVEATLVAQGSKDELYQADGTFKNHTPGEFTISALNGLINDLPKDWNPLNAQITKIGLETMRDFKYDHAEMKCRFYGREGNGQLRFSGPDGSRNFDINVYDHRWRTDDGKKEGVKVMVNNDEIRMTKSE